MNGIETVCRSRVRSTLWALFDLVELISIAVNVLSSVSCVARNDLIALLIDTCSAYSTP